MAPAAFQITQFPDLTGDPVKSQIAPELETKEELEKQQLNKSSFKQSKIGFFVGEKDDGNEPPDPPMPKISFEDILEKLGCFGWFQVLVVLLLLLNEIGCSFLVFIPIFASRSTSPEICNASASDEYILPPTNRSSDVFNYAIISLNKTVETVLPFASKSIVDGIRGIVQSPGQYESIVDEWDLKCDRAWVPDVFTSLMNAGMIVGNLVASQAADWYGRRTTYLWTVTFMAISTAMAGLSPTIYIYAFANFLAGAAFNGFLNVSSMGVMEFMTARWRSVANCMGLLGEGIMLLSLLAYFIRPWRLLYLATLSPYILTFIPIFFFLPESPRWLIRNNQLKQAHHVLNYMAKLNRKEPISMEVLEALRRQEVGAAEAQEASKSQRISYLDFARSRALFSTALYLFAIWFAWNVAYYGISYNIRNVPGDIYISVALIGLANAVGQRTSYLICDKIGRRQAVLASMTFSAVLLVALAFAFLIVEEVSGHLVLPVCILALFAMSVCRCAVRLLSGESFPTAVRTMGLGVGGLGANVAGLVTPQLAFLGSRWPPLPFFIFAGVAVAGSLVVFMMKETNGAPLSDEVEIGNKNKKSKQEV